MVVQLLPLLAHIKRVAGLISGSGPFLELELDLILIYADLDFL